MTQSTSPHMTVDRIPSPRKTTHLDSLDQLPSHLGLLSGTGGPVALSQEMRAHYAVLLIDSELKRVLLVCSTEVKGLPDEYIELSERLSRQGYSRESRWTATPDVIADIYHNNAPADQTDAPEHSSQQGMGHLEVILERLSMYDGSALLFEVRDTEASVYCKRQGGISMIEAWTAEDVNQVAAAILSSAGHSFDPRVTNQASSIATIGSKGRYKYELLSIPVLPSGHDVSISIKRLQQPYEHRPLQELGFSRIHENLLLGALCKPSGVIIIAGTADSRQGDTVNSIVKHQITERGKMVLFLEEPEQLIEDAIYLAGNDTTRATKSVQGTTADIIILGEIRTPDDADLLVKAAQSGKQVIATMSAASAFSVPAILRSVGIDKAILGSPDFLSCIVFQASIPALCSHCSLSVQQFSKVVTREADRALLMRLFGSMKGADVQRLHFRNLTDENCGNERCCRGTSGSSLACEVVVPDLYMRKFLSEGRDAEAMMHHRYKGGRVALEHGIAKCVQELFDIRDVESALGLISTIDEHRRAVFMQYSMKDNAGDFRIYVDDFVGESAAPCISDEQFDKSFSDFISASELPSGRHKRASVKADIPPPFSDKFAVSKALDELVESIKKKNAPSGCPSDQGLSPCSQDFDLDDTNLDSLIHSIDSLAENADPEPLGGSHSRHRTLSPPEHSGHPVNACDNSGHRGKPVVDIRTNTSGDKDFPNAKSVAIDATMARARRVTDLLETTLDDELKREGISLTAEFLLEHATEETLQVLSEVEPTPEIRSELKELIKEPSTIQILRDLSERELMSLTSKTRTPGDAKPFKSKLLGQAGVKAKKMSGQKATVRSIDSARKLKSPTEKPE